MRRLREDSSHLTAEEGGDRKKQVGGASRYRDSSTSVIVGRRDGRDGIAPRAASRSIRG